MVVIRLARYGSKGRPFYNIVVTDSRNARDGKPIERIGYFNPIATSTQTPIDLNLVRLKYWQSQGARPSLTVANLVKKFLKNTSQTQVKAETKTTA